MRAGQGIGVLTEALRRPDVCSGGRAGRCVCCAGPPALLDCVSVIDVQLFPEDTCGPIRRETWHGAFGGFFIGLA